MHSVMIGNYIYNIYLQYIYIYSCLYLHSRAICIPKSRGLAPDLPRLLSTCLVTGICMTSSTNSTCTRPQWLDGRNHETSWCQFKNLRFTSTSSRNNMKSTMVSAKHNSHSWPMLHLWHLYRTLDFFNHRHMNLAKIINEIILQWVLNPPLNLQKKVNPKWMIFGTSSRWSHILQ